MTVLWQRAEASNRHLFFFLSLQYFSPLRSPVRTVSSRQQCCLEKRISRYHVCYLFLLHTELNMSCSPNLNRMLLFSLIFLFFHHAQCYDWKTAFFKQQVSIISIIRMRNTYDILCIASLTRIMSTSHDL